MTAEQSEMRRRLRQARLARGKSLKVIAGLAGISESHLSNLEHGRRALDRRSLVKRLADALQIAPTDITSGTLMVNILTAQRDCDYVYVGQHLPSLIRDLHTTLDAHRDERDVLRMLALTHVQGTQAWLMDIGASIDLGWQAVVLAKAAADRLGEPMSQGVAAFGRSFGLLAAGAFPLAARVLIEPEVCTATSDAMQMSGMLALTSSLVAAARGDQADRVSALDYAADLAKHVGDDGNAMWLGFGPSNVGVVRMSVALEAGEHAEAAHIATTINPAALPSPPDSPPTGVHSQEVMNIETSADLWSGGYVPARRKGQLHQGDRPGTGHRRVDIAVHSMKDVPGDVPLPKGTAFGAYLERGDVHDVVISRDGRQLADLPAGSRIGTSAVRRRAQLGLYRPDLTIERVRSGVDTRIEKLDVGEYDALLLARVGLERMNLDHRITEVLPPTWADGETVAMVPAVGAAVIGVQARVEDESVMRLLDEINHPATALHITAERTMLHMLRGHCNSPIVGHAHTTPAGQLSLFGMVFNRDGSAWVRSHGWGPTDDPASLGAWVAGDLLRQGDRRLIMAPSSEPRAVSLNGNRVWAITCTGRASSTMVLSSLPNW